MQVNIESKTADFSGPVDKKALNYVIRVSLIAALGGFLFGFETAVISGAEKTIQQLWSLHGFSQGFTVASSLIGTILRFPDRRCARATLRKKKSIERDCIAISFFSYWFRFIAGLDIVYYISHSSVD